MKLKEIIDSAQEFETAGAGMDLVMDMLNREVEIYAGAGNKLEIVAVYTDQPCSDTPGKKIVIDVEPKKTKRRVVKKSRRDEHDDECQCDKCEREFRELACRRLRDD